MSTIPLILWTPQLADCSEDLVFAYLPFSSRCIFAELHTLHIYSESEYIRQPVNIPLTLCPLLTFTLCEIIFLCRHKALCWLNLNPSLICLKYVRRPRLTWRSWSTAPGPSETTTSWRLHVSSTAPWDRWIWLDKMAPRSVTWQHS